MAMVKALMVVMGVLILTLAGLIVYGFVQKAQNPDFKFFSDDTPAKTQPSELPTPAQGLGAVQTPTMPVTSFGEVTLDLPTTARVVSAQASAGRLVVVIARDGQNADMVAVIDLGTGKVLGRVKTSR